MPGVAASWAAVGGFVLDSPCRRSSTGRRAASARWLVALRAPTRPCCSVPGWGRHGRAMICSASAFCWTVTDGFPGSAGDCRAAGAASRLASVGSTLKLAIVSSSRCFASASRRRINSVAMARRPCSICDDNNSHRSHLARCDAGAGQGGGVTSPRKRSSRTTSVSTTASPARRARASANSRPARPRPTTSNCCTRTHGLFLLANRLHGPGQVNYARGRTISARLRHCALRQELHRRARRSRRRLVRDKVVVRTGAGGAGPLT